MTIQEAFEIIKNEMPYESGVINEALKMVEGALEKQIPKKPIGKEVIGVSMSGYKHKGNCPKCSSSVRQYTSNYCPNCGQALDWSEIEE